MTLSDRWWLVRLGVVVLVIGSGPLLLTIGLAKLGVTSDPNPNPIGFGILAMLTFWPSIVAILAGLVRARVQRPK